MTKGLGSYENPQRYFRLHGDESQKTLLQALESTFTNRKTGRKNENLIKALATRQEQAFYESARQVDYGSKELLAQALQQYYGSLKLARTAMADIKVRRRGFKVHKVRGEGYLKKRMSITAFAKKNARALKTGARVTWATTRKELKLVSPKQAAAYRRQTRTRLL